MQGQAPSQGPEAPHLAVSQDDLSDAANDSDEVEDVPGVTEIVLPGGSKHSTPGERGRTFFIT